MSSNQFEQTYTLEQAAYRCGVASYAVRFWVDQFPILRSSDNKPKTSFTEHDIALIMRIRKLIYVDRMPIAEAKKRLEQESRFPVRDPLSVAGARPQTVAAAPAEKKPEEVKAEEKAVSDEEAGRKDEEIAELKARIAKLTEEKESLASELEQAGQRIAALEAANREIAAGRSDAESGIEAVRQENGELLRRLQAAADYSNRVSAALSSLIEGMEDVKRDLEA